MQPYFYVSWYTKKKVYIWGVMIHILVVYIIIYYGLGQSFLFLKGFCSPLKWMKYWNILFRKKQKKLFFFTNIIKFLYLCSQIMIIYKKNLLVWFNRRTTKKDILIYLWRLSIHYVINTYQHRLFNWGLFSGPLVEK